MADGDYDFAPTPAPPLDSPRLMPVPAPPAPRPAFAVPRMSNTPDMPVPAPPGPQPAPPQPAPAVPAASAAPAGAAAPGADPLQPDFAQYDALMAKLGDPLDYAARANAERQAAYNQGMGGLQAATRDRNAAAANRPQMGSAGPEPQQGMGMESAGKWIMLASAIGAISSLGGRRGAINAMTAFSGLLDGVKDGNKQAFEQNKVIWEQENKRLLQQYQMQRDAYNDILNAKDKTVEEKKLELQQAMIMQKDQIGLEMLARGDLKGFAELAMKREAMIMQAKNEYLRINAQERKNNPDPTLSKESIETAAQNYRMTNKFPPNMGRGIQGNANRDAIMNRAAELDEIDAPMTGATAPRAAEYEASRRADTASLTKLQVQQDAVTAFEKNAIANGERLIELAKKKDATGIPVFDRWLNAGRQATGDEDVAAFMFQYEVYKAEAAKIVSNPNLAGVLTEGARHEFAQAFPSAATAGQMERMFNLAKLDFETRAKSVKEQLDAVRQRLRGGGGAAAAPAAPAPSASGTPSFTGRTGTTPDGKKWRETSPDNWVEVP